MDRSAPSRKPRHSTADLLTWTEAAHPPSNGVSKVVFGGQITEEEAESVLKRKPCSGPKLKETTGSGIFSVNSGDAASEPGSSFSTPIQQTSLRMYQPTSIAEVANQRELSGSLQSESDNRLNKQLSNAKCKELSGHDIFSSPPEVTLRASEAPNLERNDKDLRETTSRNLQTPTVVGHSNLLFGEEPVVKTAKKIHSQKLAELTGNGIFKDGARPGLVEKTLSTAKLKEMSGSDIFADGKASSRDHFGGVRRPPGGGSSIALV